MDSKQQNQFQSVGEFNFEVQENMMKNSLLINFMIKDLQRNNLSYTFDIVQRARELEELTDQMCDEYEKDLPMSMRYNAPRGNWYNQN